MEERADSHHHSVSKTKKRLWLRQKVLNLLWGLCVVAMISAGFIMAGVMCDSWVNRVDVLKNPLHIDDGMGTGPDWSLVSAGMLGSLFASLLVFLLLRHRYTGLKFRGAMEYTTLMILALNSGARFKYAKIKTPVKDETPEDKLAREIHQLKAEAGLAGWSGEAFDDQVNMLREAFNTESAQRLHKVKLETEKMLSMMTHTIGAMPAVHRVAVVLIAISFLGAAIMAWGLTLGAFHMPKEADDEVWVECLWQTVNFMFTIVAVWQGPQRVWLIYHLCRRNYEVTIDGVVRTLMQPGVLITRRQMLIVASLRLGNVIFQYAVNFFQWAWFRRCWEEGLYEFKLCTSRPAWGIIVFLVPAIMCNNFANGGLHYFITNCEYMSWPTDHTWDDVPSSLSVTRQICHEEHVTRNMRILSENSGLPCLTTQVAVDATAPADKREEDKDGQQECAI